MKIYHVTAILAGCAFAYAVGWEGYHNHMHSLYEGVGIYLEFLFLGLTVALKPETKRMVTPNETSNHRSLARVRGCGWRCEVSDDVELWCGECQQSLESESQLAAMSAERDELQRENAVVRMATDILAKRLRAARSGSTVFWERESNQAMTEARAEIEKDSK